VYLTPTEIATVDGLAQTAGVSRAEWFRALILKAISRGKK
jgi:hypothetical protein